VQKIWGGAPIILLRGITPAGDYGGDTKPLGGHIKINRGPKREIWRRNPLSQIFPTNWGVLPSFSNWGHPAFFGFGKIFSKGLGPKEGPQNGLLVN